MRDLLNERLQKLREERERRLGETDKLSSLGALATAFQRDKGQKWENPLQAQQDRASLDFDDQRKTALMQHLEGLKDRRAGENRNFQSKEAQKSRDFRSEQAEMARQDSAAERQRDRDFRRGEAARSRQDKLESLKQKLPKKPKITASQHQAGTFARRMQQAEDAFQDIEAKGYDRSDFTSALGASSPDWLNFMRSPEGQQNDQAERNFINAALRRESGAAISEGEFQNAEKQYFPRAGDSPEVIEQKRKNRAIVLKGLSTEAGPELMEQEASPLTENTKVVGGKTYRKVQGGWEEI
jgi:hypothetical protein